MSYDLACWVIQVTFASFANFVKFYYNKTERKLGILVLLANI